MDADANLERIAAAIGDARRIRMLALLMEGRALTAKELALGAGIEPSTATAHLRRLLGDGLIAVTAQGRHKYFRFASEQVARFVESLMCLAPRGPAGSPTATGDPIRHARFCYDHLAGGLGTSLLARMLRKGWLKAHPAVPGQLRLTPRGERALRTLGLDVEAVRRKRRKFACRCLDWSERQDHLAGALGAALAEQFTALKWIERQQCSRIVRVTRAGARGLGGLGLAPSRSLKS